MAADDMTSYEPFPRHDYMKKFKMEAQKLESAETKKKRAKTGREDFPRPEEAIMQFVNKHLKVITMQITVTPVF